MTAGREIERVERERRDHEIGAEHVLMMSARMPSNT